MLIIANETSHITVTQPDYESLRVPPPPRTSGAGVVRVRQVVGPMFGRIGVLVQFALIGALFAACNTIEGMGKDIQKAGESIEGAAAKKK